MMRRATPSLQTLLSPTTTDLLRKLSNTAVRLNQSLAFALTVVDSNPATDSDVSCNSCTEGEKLLDGDIRKDNLRRYSRLLHEFASRGSLGSGRATHGNILRNRVDPDSHLWITLLSFYAKCGNLAIARKVFESMPERDVVSWTALIDGFVKNGYAKDGIKMFCEMRNRGVRPNEFTFATCLKACSMCLGFLVGEQVHGEVVKSGFGLDFFVGSALVQLYAGCGQMELAASVFFSIPKQNVVLWSALLNGYAMAGDIDKVMNLFCSMRERELKFNKFTLCTVLKCCTSSRKLKEGQILHAVITKVACEVDNVVGCSLIDMYSKCGSVGDALTAFHGTKNPDVAMWTALLTCLDDQGCSCEMSWMFNLMRQRGVRPNIFSLTSLVSAAGNLGHLNYGKSAHGLICKYGFVLDITAGNALVSMYMKNGCLLDGVQVFEAMEEKDSVSWNALFHGWEDGKAGIPVPIVHNMLSANSRPSVSTFIGILRSCSSSLNVDFGKQLHAHIVKNRLVNNTVVGTALFDMYARNKCLDEAGSVFRRLANRDLLSWTIMISDLVRVDEEEQAIKHFILMQREGMKPNEFTLASCLIGCSRMATLESGRLLHSMTIKAGHSDDNFVASALIDMYGKCGCIEEAEAVFEGLASHDTALWNTIICLYPHHGQGVKALDTFQRMLDEGTMPDEITFIGVLSACSYMGLIYEGEKHFNSIGQTFGIPRTIKHFACVVDMFGRAGRFDDAERFIHAMKMSQNALVWETLLGACEMHGNSDIGKRAAERLFQLEPREATNFILLSNIFAAEKNWSNVQEVRALMTSKGVKKEQACSWVEVDGTVHVFASQDYLHPKLDEIYKKLEELAQLLASVGYIPKVEYVLQNVPKREKMGFLHHHSERLALAFVLISTNIKKRIRIFKNNRICSDCHDVMGLISDIVDREIIVRDFKEFHHFKKGICSCQTSK